jgi:RNA polymerase sigma-70 factor (ECF subfamily)
MLPDPDHSFVQACQEGGQAGFDGAFRRLYDRYKDRVYNVCFRITGNASDALDASQETFGILYRKIGVFRFHSRFSSWVYRIAVNASIDLKRRQSSRRLASLDWMQTSTDAEQRGLDVADEHIEMPMAMASRHELEQEIQHAIDRLSPKLRAITVLRYTENLSYEEIAEALDISIGTVKSRLARAHGALDRELAPVLHKHYLG